MKGLKGTPEMPVGVMIMVQVPPSFRGLSKKEIRRKLSHPGNVEAMLDEFADTIVKYFNKPVDYRELITNLASQLTPNVGDGN